MDLQASTYCPLVVWQHCACLIWTHQSCDFGPLPPLGKRVFQGLMFISAPCVISRMCLQRSFVVTSTVRNMKKSIKLWNERKPRLEMSAKARNGMQALMTSINDKHCVHTGLVFTPEKSTSRCHRRVGAHHQPKGNDACYSTFQLGCWLVSWSDPFHSVWEGPRAV